MKSEFSRDIAVLIRYRVSDLYVLPYRSYYRLLIMHEGQLQLYQQWPLPLGKRLIAVCRTNGIRKDNDDVSSGASVR